MSHIFVSHASKDDDAVTRLHDQLEAATGENLWVDHKDIPPGANWQDAVETARRTCDKFILALSRNALLEPGVTRTEITSEWRGALFDGIPFLMVILDDLPTAEITDRLKLIQWVSLYPDWDGGIQKLVEAIQGKASGDSAVFTRAAITGGDVMREHLPYLLSVPLTGRADDLNNIHAELGAHVTQIIAVGGMGKSRIAAEIALNHANGAVWHRCSPDSAPYQVVDLLRRHLRLDKDTPDDQVLAALDGKPPLVVLDNAEDIPARSDRRAAYVSLAGRLAGRGVPVLLTGRGVWDELKPRREYPLQPINLEEAARVALAFAAAEDVPLEASAAPELAEAARLHPRLIEFAVRQLHERELPAVLRQLRELKHPEVQEALDEMIVKTVRQMAEQARYGAAAERLLRRLAVFRGTFDREALRALAPEDMGEDAVEDALTTLLRWRFVEKPAPLAPLPQGEGKITRYRVEEVVSGALPPEGDAPERHFTHYLNLHGDSDANNDEDRHPLITADWENVRAALNWGLADQPEAAADWVSALRYYMDMRVSLAEWGEVTQAGYDSALKAGYERGQANTLIALGDLSVRRAELDAARAFYDRALPIYDTIGDRIGQANTLIALGDLSVRRAELDAARAFYDRALPIYDTIGDRIGQANTLIALGDLSVRRAELDAARAFYDRALPIYDTIGARIGQANTLRALGDLSVRRAELDAARAFYDRALPIYDTIGDRIGQANTLKALGDLSVRRAELDAARAFYDRALPIYDTIGARLGQANTLKALGDLSVRRAELDAARAFYDRALPIYDTIGDRIGQANTLIALGDLSVRRAELDAARAFYDRALPIYDTIGDRIGQANTLIALGDLFQQGEYWQDALAKYEISLTIFRAIGDSYSEAITRRRMWPTLAELGQVEQAVAGILFAGETYTRIGLHHYTELVQDSMRDLREQVGAEAFAAAWKTLTDGADMPDWLTE